MKKSGKDKEFQALKAADDKDQIGYARYLCEVYLKDHPDHGPTLLKYARNLISLAQYSKAMTVLDHAQTIVPEKYQHQMWYHRGYLLEARGEFLKAEKMFMRAHFLKPNDATALIFAASAAFRRGDLNTAKKVARKATKCSEGCIDEAFFNLGGYLLSMRRYEEAAECYRKALKIDKDYKIAKERLKDVKLILKKEAGRAGSKTV